MKQKSDEVRTLAIRLFNASRRQKKAHGPHIWHDTQWRDLPSESVEVWDAVAIEAFKRLQTLKGLAEYVNEQARVADANAKEWQAVAPDGKEHAAYRAGMWYAYNDVRNRLPQ